MVTTTFPISNTGRTHGHFPQPHKESRDDAAEIASPGPVNRFPSARMPLPLQHRLFVSHVASATWPIFGGLNA
jgi:hypothetical protein